LARCLATALKKHVSCVSQWECRIGVRIDRSSPTVQTVIMKGKELLFETLIDEVPRRNSDLKARISVRFHWGMTYATFSSVYCVVIYEHCTPIFITVCHF
jgi:hypothetical protein